MLCPTCPALLELHHGVPAAGGVLVAINTRLSSHEIRSILEHCGALESLPVARGERLDVSLATSIELMLTPF